MTYPVFLRSEREIPTHKAEPRSMCGFFIAILRSATNLFDLHFGFSFSTFEILQILYFIIMKSFRFGLEFTVLFDSVAVACGWRLYVLVVQFILMLCMVCSCCGIAYNNPILISTWLFGSLLLLALSSYHIINHHPLVFIIRLNTHFSCTVERFSFITCVWRKRCVVGFRCMCGFLFVARGKLPKFHLGFLINKQF